MQHDYFLYGTRGVNPLKCQGLNLKTRVGTRIGRTQKNNKFILATTQNISGNMIRQQNTFSRSGWDHNFASPTSEKLNIQKIRKHTVAIFLHGFISD